MKQRFSFLSLILVLALFVGTRLVYFQNNTQNGYNATSWDAFGYYMYLPAQFIYHDVKELKWIPKMDSRYHLTGGNLYQAMPIENQGGITYTNKYLSGVAMLESPFFGAGHLVAKIWDAPQDGFSWPYQYAILWGAIFWCFVGFLVLRKVLLRYFDDQVTALTLLLLAFTSNLIQYVAVDGGMSHAYIFPLYALLLWWTIRWHEAPKKSLALLIGLVCGLAVISRPTELIMIFIPILWNTHTKEEKSKKWKQVFSNKSAIYLAVLGGIIGIFPQLLYWKFTTGTWVFDVGSKWYFLNPWFRVLVGPEIGWFLYTPIALLMVIGLFRMQGQPYRKAVLTFCLLNIWIIISWSDWKYGATYSTRALTQSYPVFALPLAGMVWYFIQKKKTMLLYGIGIVLVILNFYQLGIYNRGVVTNFSPLLF